VSGRRPGTVTTKPDLPRHYPIRESSHRILNAMTPAKLATLGAALQLPPGSTMLDLACGKGETLCTWSRDLGFTGTGVDISTVYITAARERAQQLGVAGAVRFVHDDASAYVSDEPVDIASCCGATWIGDGVPGTMTLLQRSLAPGGVLLIGEPFWRSEPPDRSAVEGYDGEFSTLPELMETFARLGYDVVEMMHADPDCWDRYVAAQWMNIRRFIDAHPDDELTPTLRAHLDSAPLSYVCNQRDHLGWAIFVLKGR